MRGERIDLSRIPFDDQRDLRRDPGAPTRWASSRSSPRADASLRRTRPEKLEDLTIQVAIVRPGPILGGAVNPYIERRQRLREDPDFVVPYEHPSLEPVLSDTLGTIIFQDQVIEVAMAFAGFSPGEAEGLRRAMSRKRSAAAIEAYHERFLEGAAATHGVDAETAERVYDDDRRLLGLRLPQGPRRRLRPARLPVDLAARALRPGVPVRAAQRAADGLLRVGHARARGAAARHRDAARPTSTRARPSARSADARPAPASGSGSGYVLGVRGARRSSALVAARARRAGRSARWPTSPRAPARAGRRWSSSRGRARATRFGARPSGAPRRRCGSSASRRPASAARRAPSSRCRSRCPRAPELRALDRRGRRWSPTTRRPALTLGPHPMELLRPTLPARHRRRCARPRARCRTRRRCSIGGLVVARQRPGTAKGIVFLLLEDEFGTINLIVPPPVYERHRLLVRTEPLMLRRGPAGAAAAGRRRDQRLRRRPRAADARREAPTPAPMLPSALGRGAARGGGRRAQPARAGGLPRGRARGQSFASGRRR